MIYDPLVWFNPAYMIHCGIEAKKHFEADGAKLSSEMRKAIEESFSVSVMALGVNQLLNMQLRVQLVNPQERSPDVRAMYEVPMPESTKYDFKMEYWDVEVVTLEEHSDEEPDEFIKRTKFAAKKSYDAMTIILCYINKDVKDGKLWRDVSKELQSLKTPNNIFVLDKAHPTKAIYQVARVNPTFDSILEFDVMEEAKKKYDKSGGTLFTEVLGRKTEREQKSGINPFLED
jgi:hypothetical protein